MVIDCEFCQEFNGFKQGLFYKLYNGVITSRVIYEDDSFMVIPTIGQLFKYSLLVLPKEHTETLSKLIPKDLHHLERLYKEIKKELSKFGYVVAFEHGALCNAAGDCGVYHAHLHLISVPENVSMSGFFKHKHVICNDLISGLVEAGKATEYLLCVDNNGSSAILDVSKIASEYPSQFFRKALWKYFQLEKSWNWKDYQYREELLINSIHDIKI